MFYFRLCNKDFVTKFLQNSCIPTLMRLDITREKLWLFSPINNILKIYMDLSEIVLQSTFGY